MHPEQDVPPSLIQTNQDLHFFRRKERAFNHLVRTFRKDLNLGLSEQDLVSKGAVDRRRINASKNANRSVAAKKRKRMEDGKFKQGGKKDLFGVVKTAEEQPDIQIGDDMLEEFQ